MYILKGEAITLKCKEAIENIQATMGKFIKNDLCM